jgi:4-hydroxybenzoate adenylyltransferase
MQAVSHESENIGICKQTTTSVVVIGGGVAGIWAAYQLVSIGIDTIMVSYGGDDRGGIQGASHRSAGAFNTCQATASDLHAYLQEVGCGQTHPSVARTLIEHLPKALAELSSLIELKPIKIGLAPASGSGKELINALYERFRSLGGKSINGWVTRLIADWRSCRGVQYESPKGIGKILCRTIVIASGGYSGLWANCMRTNCFGNVLGYYLRCGGLATNLEFVFKHGYGNIDTNALTPTEELPGAEIHNGSNERVRWLEELLFNQQGTKTHLRAVQFWLRNAEDQYYVDLSYRSLYRQIRSLNALLSNNDSNGAHHEAAVMMAISEVVEVFSDQARCRVRKLISASVQQQQEIDYATFEELKTLYERRESGRFRVRPLTYFSMGGIGHIDFATNLRGVYVTGEAMHDFGANRVGGLPWSLYLASGYVIAEQVTRELADRNQGFEDFEVLPQRSKFDDELLKEIQQCLYETQEKELTTARALESINWLRRRRAELQTRSDVLHDGISWLIVAEAIMQCSVCRTESRGFFFRSDFSEQDRNLDQLYSCAWYDAASDTVLAQLLPWVEVEMRLKDRCNRSKLAWCHDAISECC